MPGREQGNLAIPRARIVADSDGGAPSMQQDGLSLCQSIREPQISQIPELLTAPKDVLPAEARNRLGQS